MDGTGRSVLWYAITRSTWSANGAVRIVKAAMPALWRLTESSAPLDEQLPQSLTPIRSSPRSSRSCPNRRWLIGMLADDL